MSTQRPVDAIRANMSAASSSDAEHIAGRSTAKHRSTGWRSDCCSPRGMRRTTMRGAGARRPEALRGYSSVSVRAAHAFMASRMDCRRLARRDLALDESVEQISLQRSQKRQRTVKLRISNGAALCLPPTPINRYSSSIGMLLQSNRFVRDSAMPGSSCARSPTAPRPSPPWRSGRRIWSSSTGTCRASPRSS